MRIGAGVILDKPIHLIQLDGRPSPPSTVTRNVVIAEPGSSATLIESFASLGIQGLQRNAVTEVKVGEKAALRHVKLQREGEDTIHLSTWLVELAADARYDVFQFSTCSSVARNQVYLRFAGEGSVLDISGTFLLRGRQHCRYDAPR